MKSLSLYLSKVFYVLESNRRELVLLLAAFMSASILEAFGIGLIGPFISIAFDPDIVRQHLISKSLIVDGLGLQTDSEIILAVTVFVIAIFCIKSLAYFLCKLYIYRFSYSRKVELETRLVHTYLNIPYLFHLRRNSASLIKNIVFESNQFTTNCLIPLLEIVANLVVLITLLALLAKTNFTLLAFSLAVLLPIFLIFNKLSKRVRKWGKVKSEAHQAILRVINHGLGGIKETKIIGCQDYFETELRESARQLAKASVFVQAFQLLPRISIEATLIIFLIVLVAFVQIFLVDSVEQFSSILGIFAIASLRMAPIASQTLNAVIRMRASSHALDMLYLDLHEIDGYNLTSKRDSQGTSSLNKQAFPPNRYSISFKDLTFAYPNISEPAIRNVSLSFQKGESIAFVGKSGAGKTTLVDLLLGLITPDSGDICIDGVSIYQDLRKWQDLVGYIPQAIFLTDETIEQNIAFGVPEGEIDQDRLQMAIQAAQLEELVMDLPNGVRTQVGERGVRLSGGQRQRIGIARALYHQRQILVLDEATSALDSETEKLVSNAINSLAGSKTLIIIAHRISTIESCDRIYMLEKGELKRSGTYAEIFMSKA
ncbi:MAG: ATP-binding cassette domain-containing protein [Cyanobacteria bacterium P01_G01_bin.38]